MKTWMAAAAAAAALAVSPAFAHGGDKCQGGTGGSASAGQAGEHQLQGTVIKLEGKNLFIDHMGASVPLELRGDTKFQGQANAKQDLKPGQQITASFEVKGTRNIASRIESSQAGTGGSGDVRPPDTNKEPDLLDTPTRFPDESTPPPPND